MYELYMNLKQMNLKQMNLKQSSRKKWNRGKTVLLLMTIPSFLMVLVFSYAPLTGWAYAFFEYRIGMKLFQCEYRGLYFLKLALFEPDLLRVIKNTLVISFLTLLNIPIACAFAIFLSEMRGRMFKKFVQTATTLPYFISWIIVFLITFSFFAPESGLVNNILGDLNLNFKPIDPLANVNIARFFQVGLFMWKHVGYNAIIFFAAITGIDLQLYDAAKVDGAGRFRKIWHVTVPGVVPVFITLLLINIGWMLSNGFEQYFVFMNYVVQSKIEVMDYYVYRVGLKQMDIPVSTALSMTNTLISVILLFSANWLSKKARGQSII